MYLEGSDDIYEISPLSSPTRMVPSKMMMLLMPCVDNFEFEALKEELRWNYILAQRRLNNICFCSLALSGSPLQLRGQCKYLSICQLWVLSLLIPVIVYRNEGRCYVLAMLAKGKRIAYTSIQMQRSLQWSKHLKRYITVTCLIRFPLIWLLKKKITTVSLAPAL